VAEMGDHLAIIDMDRKLRGLCPFGEGNWVPIKHNVTKAEAYLPTKWLASSSSCLATTHGPKIGGCPLWGRGSWVLI